MGCKNGKDVIADGWSDEETVKYINDNNIVCPNCGKLNYTSIRKFNLMFKTFKVLLKMQKMKYI